ncbi:uncharacterized protein BYT42DRAFT_500791 [Radiomyces spectabilis]|uniref:uncharacterized protein n=1 Tax=Radiomyces spectabilis TaxID=64574 RepID=UPI00221E8913|nr:uncharacterized protein BYT42DRAFT_500791 [Radiomyces spectabilis]KAI8372711.1 hypothetical protein BYT42DRAFT_500791 [Radiomyces spectabilis]
MSLHSFLALDTTDETDSDKDLVIHSLNESLHIHKEILERIQLEKDTYTAQVEKERQNEREERESTMHVLEHQKEEYARLETAYESLKKDLESIKEEYKRMENNFYAHVRQIRATDDDLSTIQSEISHLSSQCNNFCMGLKPILDRSLGTQFVWDQWPEKEAAIQRLFKGDDATTLEPGYITMFTEKFIAETILEHVLEPPIHMGVSVNEAYRALSAWIESRNTEWSNRLRQQVCALIAKHAETEQENIDQAMEELTEYIMKQLARVYPRIHQKEQHKNKIMQLVKRAAKLNLAMKGQEIKIERIAIDEGCAYDSALMKAASKGKPEGTVLFVITPGFAANDPKDEHHGFVVPAKVYCV